MATYDTKDKCPSVQQICVQIAITFIVRKTGLICIMLVDLMAGQQKKSCSVISFLNVVY